MTKIGIVGYGHVGKAIHALFPIASVYDEPMEIGSKSEVNACEVAFICVPTPSLPDGQCDTSIVEEVISWLGATVIVIRSTVPVGFTDAMKERTGKRIVFQPEYYGETVDHHFSDLRHRTWLTFEGSPLTSAWSFAPISKCTMQRFEFGRRMPVPQNWRSIWRTASLHLKYPFAMSSMISPSPWH